MRNAVIAFVIVALMCTLSTAAEKSSQSRLSKKERQRLLALVDSLGSGRYRERCNAQSELMAAPPSAHPLLINALAQASDPEVQYRLKMILHFFAQRLAYEPRGYSVSCNYNNERLENVLRDFERQLHLEPRALSCFIPPEAASTLVTFRLDGMQDQMALRWLFRFARFDEMLPYNAVERCYDVGGLIFSPKDLADEYKAIWLTEGDSQPEPETTLHGSTLTLRCDLHAHKRFEFLLAQFAAQKGACRVRIRQADVAGCEDLVEALDSRTVSFCFSGVRIDAALAYLQDTTSLPIFLDAQIKVADVPPITLKVTNMPVRLALEWIQGLTNYGMTIRDGAVVFTGFEACTEYLVASIEARVREKTTIVQILDDLRARVLPESWDAALGTHMSDRGEHLMVRHTTQALDQVERALDVREKFWIAVHKAETNGLQGPLKLADVPREAADPPRVYSLRMDAARHKPLSFNYIDVPLGEVLVDLTSKLSIPIDLDEGVVNMGADMTPITFFARDMPAERAFRWIERLSDLECVFEHSRILVTGRKDGNPRNLRSELYYVRDLESLAPAKQLAAIITEDLLPLDFKRPHVKIEEHVGGLLVTHYPEVHERIRAFLDGLRERAHDKSIRIEQLAGLRESDARLAAALQRPLTLTFCETGAWDVVFELQQQTGVSIVIDPSASDKLECVSMRNRELTLEAALQEVGLGITWTVRDGVIVVNAAGCDSTLEARLYDVSDIDTGDLSEFADTIVNTVKPETWCARVCIQILPNRLLITQTPEGHRLVGEYLEKLRRERVLAKKD
ncbi:MAG TPA: hypothetical protein VEJ63_24020 [Planctomycetota bacterium]|nr:hypothetical protein [Planctomycetota bacterium]